MNYSTLIFDLDGTLVDSKINYTAIYQALKLDPEQSIIGYVNSLGESERKAAMEIVNYYEDEGARLSVPVPGAAELLAELHRRGVNVGVFTLNSRQTALKTLKLHQLQIPMLVAREDAKPKPDPEGLLKICKHYSSAHHEALYVGDYKYDLIAGKNANIKTALYSATAPDFCTADAYLKFSHFEELAHYLFASPSRT